MCNAFCYFLFDAIFFSSSSFLKCSHILHVVGMTDTQWMVAHNVKTVSTFAGPVPESGHQGPSPVPHRTLLTHLPEGTSKGTAPYASEPGLTSSSTCVCGWHCIDFWGQLRNLSLVCQCRTQTWAASQRSSGKRETMMGVLAEGNSHMELLTHLLEG